ncbi:hypothetical protein, partial [Streptomyces albipurpureus]
MTSVLVPAPPVWSDRLETSAIPIDRHSATSSLLYRVVLPATAAGDVLDITAKAGVTNDAGHPGGQTYMVGVGWHIWWYDYNHPDRSAGPWTQIKPWSGQNVDHALHHLALNAAFCWRVPDDWPEGHRMVVCLKASAHSTAWQRNGGG